MSKQEAEVREVPVQTFEDLVTKLYDLAKKYSDSFSGNVFKHRGGAKIRANVREGTKQVSYSFTHPNRITSLSFHERLAGHGLMNCTGSA